MGTYLPASGEFPVIFFGARPLRQVQHVPRAVERGGGGPPADQPHGDPMLKAGCKRRGQRLGDEKVREKVGKR